MMTEHKNLTFEAYCAEVAEPWEADDLSVYADQGIDTEAVAQALNARYDGSDTPALSEEELELCDCIAADEIHTNLIEAAMVGCNGYFEHDEKICDLYGEVASLRRQLAAVANRIKDHEMV
jgi:hypothetical protein